MLYRVRLAWVGFELTTLVVIGTDCIGSCKFNIAWYIYLLIFILYYREQITNQRAGWNANLEKSCWNKSIGYQNKKIQEELKLAAKASLAVSQIHKTQKDFMKRIFKQWWSTIFHQYQNTEQPPLTTNNWSQRRPQYMTLEIQILAWDRNKYVVGLNGVMVNQTYTTLVLLQTDNNEGKFRKYFILIRTQWIVN